MRRNVLQWRLPGGFTVLFGSLIVALVLVGDEPDRRQRRLEWSPPEGYSGTIEAISFAPNGTQLSVVGRDGGRGIWDLTSDQDEPLFPESQEFTYWPTFAADGKVLAVGTHDSRVIVEDPVSNEHLLDLPPLPSMLNSLALSRDGKMLAVIYDDGDIEMWDVPRGRRLFHVRSSPARITCVKFSPDGKLLATGRSDGALVLWDTASGSIKTLMRTNSGYLANGVVLASISRIAFSPDAKALASVQYNRCDLTIWDVATGGRRATLHGASHCLKSVAFSPDGGLIAFGEIDGTVILWNAYSYQTKSIFHGHSTQVSSLCFSPDGRTLATADEDSIVRVWDVVGS
ncbi:MAG: WD40 repeat domain-containing protein [Isosphaeraceae bacterium]